MSLWSRIFSRPQKEKPRYPLLGTKFEVLGLLGRGAFGDVLAVHSLETGGIHALKSVRTRQVSPEEEELIQREAEAWFALGRHPHVAEAFFLEKIDGHLYIAMELVGPDSTGARTLADHSRAGGADPRSILRWGIQIARGMQHASRCGIRAHRDLKPSNVLIDRDGVVKVGDWGLGIVGSRDGRGFAGTTQYMAPEQLEGLGCADARSDIYSAGVLLRELVSGMQAPATAAQPTHDYLCASTGERTRLAGPLGDVLERCVRADPSVRYADFAQLEEALAGVLLSEFGETVPVLTPAEPNAATWSNRGMSLYYLGRYSEALEAFESAAEMEPDVPLYWANQGDALRALGRSDEAFSRYDKACAMGSIRGWYKKGNLHMALGCHQEAITCYRAGLRIDSRDPITLNNLGCAANAIGEHRKALRWLDKALEVEPRMSEARYNRGLAVYRLGRLEEAAADFAETGRLAPLRADAFHCRALALWRLGREDQAIHMLEHALELDPRSALSWYERGNMLASKNQFPGAVDAFKRAVELGGVPEAAERLRYAREDLKRAQRSRRV